MSYRSWYRALKIGKFAKLGLYNKEVNFIKGELIFTYRFGGMGLRCLPKYYNDIISGMSLLGEVAKDDKEDVYVKLDIDNGTGGTYPYPFRPETGNMMYCMPQVGTKISLYFPDSNEHNAMAVNCFRTNGSDCSDMADPAKRAFNTEHSKSMTLYPETMSVTSPVVGSIFLDDNNGITIKSEKAMAMLGNEIIFKAPNIQFSTVLGEILAYKCDIASNIIYSGLMLSNRVDIKSNNGTCSIGSKFDTYPAIKD